MKEAKNEWNCPEINQAMRLAHEIKLHDQDGVLGSPRYVKEDPYPLRIVKDPDDAEFEIKYMLACSQLGFTDPDVLNYMKRRKRYFK